MSTATDGLVAASVQPEIPKEGKHIHFDEVTRSYEAYWNGNVVAFAKTERQAESKLDDYCYELYRRGIL